MAEGDSVFPWNDLVEMTPADTPNPRAVIYALASLHEQLCIMTELLRDMRSDIRSAAMTADYLGRNK